MKLTNPDGQTVYYNEVTKHGRSRWQIQAASGQTLFGRDGKKLKSRTFSQEHQARAYLERNGYKTAEEEPI
jgi:hypothetical protein